MWWPSFCSVLHDLWLFVLGKDTQPYYAAAQSASDVKAHTFEVAPVFVPPVSVVEPQVQLATNIRYDAQHPVTKQIRDYLADETTIQLATADLTAYEWLAYIYTSDRRPLPWSALALAPVGYWHQTLKGQQRVVVGITPKTKTIIEWQDENQTGHIGRVVSVSPDEHIVVQQLGSVLSGVLTETTFSQAEWRELRPVFITVD